jgi:hypothetical protein
MPVDRKLLTERFYVYDIPAWSCPTCGRGHLALLDNTLPLMRPSASFRKLPLENYVEIEQDYGVFSLIAECSYKECKEAFAVSGRYYTEMGVDDRNFEVSLTVCDPVAITPPIQPIKFPPQCPDNVKDQFISAFAIMWQDANAALNRVRTALELLLDHFGVPRKGVSPDKKGGRKLVRLNLHRRIERLAQTKKYVADVIPALLAVKYLGNDGTHDTSANLDDLFDALDVSESLLARLFDPNHITTEQITSEILKSKGRRKRKNT